MFSRFSYLIGVLLLCFPCLINKLHNHCGKTYCAKRLIKCLLYGSLTWTRDLGMRSNPLLPSLSCVSSHSLDSLAMQGVDGIEPFVGLFYVILVSLQGCFRVFIGMSLTCYTTSFIGIWCKSFTLFHFPSIKVLMLLIKKRFVIISKKKRVTIIVALSHLWAAKWLFMSN